MDCCRTSRRLGGEDVKVIVRSGFEEMKASPWEKETRCTRAYDPQLSCTEDLREQERQAHRHDLREGESGL